MGYLEEQTGLGGFIQDYDIGGGQLVVKEKKRKHEAQRAKIKTAIEEQTKVARRQQADLLIQARAAAEEQANLILRDKATKDAAATLEKELDTADVQLSGPETETVVSTKAKKRKQFGFDTSGASLGDGGSYSPGVNL